jgi:hypothetical protein
VWIAAVPEMNLVSEKPSKGEGSNKEIKGTWEIFATQTCHFSKRTTSEKGDIGC